MNIPEKAAIATDVTGWLDQLARFGADADGGVTRLLYTKEWREAQAYLAGEMRNIGLDVRFDRVGNLYGRLAGTDADEKVVLTGSHIDTVRGGGRYDGAYGVAAGLAALKILKEACGPPRKPLEVVSFCEEEGSRFPLAYWGSGNASGRMDWREGDVRDAEGISLSEAMESAGFGREEQAACLRGDLAAFVELHIEQGIALERTGYRIGIVESIAGQQRFDVTVKGEANHAGTTPMPMRKDAMAAAAEMITLVEGRALSAGEPLVATVGRLEAVPNTPNVIPGFVRFTLDIRHDDERRLDRFANDIVMAIKEIAVRRGLELQVTPWLCTAPTPMNGELKKRIRRVCDNLAIPCRSMVSGAGHDAQMLASICPTAMIFVPSRKGISHSPEEYTPPDALVDGVRVLTVLLYELAYGER